MVTSCGTIVIELDAKTAPETVNSFVFLAKKQFFDAQILGPDGPEIDVIQGGSPTGSVPVTGYTIPDELPGNETYGAGTLAMANTGANTGGGQILPHQREERHHLDSDPAYTTFGTSLIGSISRNKFQRTPINPTTASQTYQVRAQRDTDLHIHHVSEAVARRLDLHHPRVDAPQRPRFTSSSADDTCTARGNLHELRVVVQTPRAPHNSRRSPTSRHGQTRRDSHNNHTRQPPKTSNSD